MEGSVFQLSFGLLEGFSSCVLQFIIAELSPVVSLLTKFSLRLERIVSKLLANRANFVRVDS